MKIVIAPDSFKGTMSATTVSSIIESAAKKVFKNANIIKVPFSDGGEGSIECFHTAIGGEIIETKSYDPLNRDITAKYLKKDDLVVIESAEACGLHLITKNQRNPLITSTFGVGKIILAALESGAKKIIFTLGGSSTNDAGTGMLSALGASFKDINSNIFIPTGGTLHLINEIDLSNLSPLLKNVEIIGMCDVKNTICGNLGATYVYAPQKGATTEQLAFMEKGMCHYIDLLEKRVNKSLFNVPGGGAAGGLGIATYALLNGKLERGIELMIKTSSLEDKIEKASIVVTGEGKLDRQSFMGKVVGGLSELTKKNNIPLAVIVGNISNEITDEIIDEHNILMVQETNPDKIPFSSIKHRAPEDLYLASTKLFQKLSNIF